MLAQKKVESVAEDVFFNSVAVAILSLLIAPLTPGGNGDLSEEVPKLLEPIREKYDYPCVEKKEVVDAVHFLKKRKVVDRVNESQSVTCSLTPFGKEVAGVLFPGYPDAEISKEVEA